VVLAAAAVAGSFWRAPFWWFEKLGRAGLQSAGLTRAVTAGPRGPLVYWHGGSGATLVLLHGANDQAGAWALVAKPLLTGNRLVAVDLAGHGESGPADGSLAVADLLTGVERVIEATAPGERVRIVGNSLGGYLAMLYAARHPERVDHVILLNGAAVQAAPGAQVSLLPKTREEARAAIEALTAPQSPRVPDYVLDDLVRRAPTSPLARLLQQPIDLSLEGNLAAFATPVTLVWGEADRYMTVAYAEGVAKQLPAARLVTLPGCGPVPQRECPQALVAAVSKALSSPPTPAAPAAATSPVMP
jgi:pimeloyl-ACP methyl ester carboxylesterase